MFNGIHSLGFKTSRRDRGRGAQQSPKTLVVIRLHHGGGLLHALHIKRIQPWVCVKDNCAASAACLLYSRKSLVLHPVSWRDFNVNAETMLLQMYFVESITDVDDREVLEAEKQSVLQILA